MTDDQPASEPTDANWNRQASTVDWEGWIAEENAADAERAKAKAAEEAARAEAGGQPPVSSFPPPTGQPVAAPGGYPAPSASYPPPTGAPQPFQAGAWSGVGGSTTPVGYAPYSSVPTSRPRDVVSVLAFIFGILPTIPLGFILGIVGIVRTANPRRKGRWMAVVGLLGSLVWLAASVLLPLYLNNRDASRDASGHVTAAGTVSVFKLRTGDCFTQNFSSTSFEVGSVKVVPCSQPHNTTVFATASMSGDWTSNDDMVARGSKACVPALKAFYQGSAKIDPVIKFGAIVPDRTIWATGNRSVRCLLSDPTKQFTGDIRND